MVNNIENTLQEISEKLNAILFLLRLQNQEKLDNIQSELSKDPIVKQILDFADGTMNASILKKRVALGQHVSERTVNRRISELLRKGVLRQYTKASEVYYEYKEF